MLGQSILEKDYDKAAFLVDLYSAFCQCGRCYILNLNNDQVWLFSAGSRPGVWRNFPGKLGITETTRAIVPVRCLLLSHTKFAMHRDFYVL
jgi:hypothetical protein